MLGRYCARARESKRTQPKRKVFLNKISSSLVQQIDLKDCATRCEEVKHSICFKGSKTRHELSQANPEQTPHNGSDILPLASSCRAPRGRRRRSWTRQRQLSLQPRDLPSSPPRATRVISCRLSLLSTPGELQIGWGDV